MLADEGVEIEVDTELLEACAEAVGKQVQVIGEVTATRQVTALSSACAPPAALIPRRLPVPQIRARIVRNIDGLDLALYKRSATVLHTALEHR